MRKAQKAKPPVGAEGFYQTSTQGVERMTDDDFTKLEPYTTRFECRNGVLYIAQVKKGSSRRCDIVVLSSEQIRRMLSHLGFNSKDEVA